MNYGQLGIISGRSNRGRLRCDLQLLSFRDGKPTRLLYFSTATRLANGEVLIVGGYARPGGPAVNHAWLYQR